MKILLQTIFLVCLGQVAFANKDSIACSIFKEGRFAYRNSSAEAVVIIRKGKWQEEHNKNQQVITKFKVRWLSACSYELTQTWSNSKAQRKENNTVTTVIITALSKDEYQYTCACKDPEDRRKNTGIVYRINKN